jgi:ribonuclease BN (tRNA processing enzyme)
MRLTFLGTNGWFDSDTGNTVCAMLETKDRYIVLDAGMGIHRLDQHMMGPKPVDLFLSHFHLDHIAGMHCIMKFVSLPGMRIIGQPGTRATLDRILAHPFTVSLDQLPFPVEVLELEEGWHDIGYKVECRLLDHVSPCFGYRIEVDGRKVAYCTDTGETENMVKLAHGVDLLISECAFRRGETNPRWPHLNPDTAIALAKRSGCKRLALTHFDAHRYRTIEERREIESLSSEFPGLIVAYDKLAVDL